MTQTLTYKNKLQQLRDMITDGKFTAIDALVLIDAPEELLQNEQEDKQDITALKKNALCQEIQTVLKKYNAYITSSDYDVPMIGFEDTDDLFKFDFMDGNETKD